MDNEYFENQHSSDSFSTFKPGATNSQAAKFIFEAFDVLHNFGDLQALKSDNFRMHTA